MCAPCEFCGNEHDIGALIPVALDGITFLVCEYCVLEQIVPAHKDEDLEKQESGMKWVNELLRSIQMPL